MSTSDLFRYLESQIETYLAPKTIEHLRENWSWDITPEENLTRAVTSVVPFILENHKRWSEGEISEGGAVDYSKLNELAPKKLQELMDKNKA